MKAWIIRAIIALVIFGVGVGAGASTAEEPEPKIRTVTETITETETVTEEVEVVPEACLEAITAARLVMDSASKFAAITQGYIKLIPDTLQAGFDVDSIAVELITSKMQDLNERVVFQTRRIKTSPFPTAAAICEGAAL